MNAMGSFRQRIEQYTVGALAVAAIAAATSGTLRAQTVAADTSAADQIARGRYLVTIAGCNDCHTPLALGPNGPEPDMTRMLSGHPQTLEMPSAPMLPEGPWLVVSAGTNTAWSGPWGVSFTANLTPDPETGLGKWTFRNFKDTIRSGRHMGRGRQILPPMPIPMYKHMTDDDLAAVFAYLQSIPAVSNRVPEPWPPAAASLTAAP
ncbi:MAG TPA: diheme cytochrome c-553 [Gammaproteobacteria bacterium]|nr:diheme cytochrome c-553 [Gammaproteobacteria bacterium]